MNDPRDPCHKVLNMNFEGKNTVVTGAAGGIGEALARRFHAAGARVVVADRDAVRLEAVAASLNAIRPDSAFAVVADIGTEAGNVALIDAARNKFGFIHLFFANAGVAQGQFLENTDEATWEAVMNINTHAHRWAAKHLIWEHLFNRFPDVEKWKINGEFKIKRGRVIRGLDSLPLQLGPARS